jgi:prepilin-type N-terminal cleavage/methylation domain-containing protein
MKMNKAGFTLIELLVVIAIIGILSAITVPGITKTKERAMRMKARTECHAIKNAVQGYFNEYGKYPLQKSISSSDEEIELNDELTNILRGKDDDWNPRKIVFLAVSQNSLVEVKNGKAEDPDDQMFSPLTDSGDSRPYRVKMDYDMDGIIKGVKMKGVSGTVDLDGTTVGVWVEGLEAELNSWE